MRKFYNLKYRHILRNLLQKLTTTNVAVIGSYHGGNVGDMALGTTIQKILASQGIASDLQTLHNLEKWPKRTFAIIGGGAVGYNEALQKVYDRYVGQFDKVAFIGVDFNEKDYSETSKILLNNAAFISCRSQHQQAKLSQILNRTDIQYHPDIVFAMNMPQQKAGASKRPKFLINAIPLYGFFEKGKLQPEVQFKQEKPEIYTHFETVHTHYRKYMLDLAMRFKTQGFDVETLPFSTEDELYCEAFFQNIDFIKHNRYTSEPSKIAALVQSADTILATRYHATILGIRNRKNIFPLAYASKNEELLQKISSNTLSNKILCIENFLKKVEPASNFEYDENIVSNMETDAQRGINRALQALNILGNA